MFECKVVGSGEVLLIGRFDASQETIAERMFGTLDGDHIIDCKDLEYISSAGIGVLLKTYKRLHTQGYRLKLINLNPSISKVFQYAGLAGLFEVA